MAHPRMYRDDDPFLAEVRELCLSLPGAEEVEAWGNPTFRAGKMFAVFNGSGGEMLALRFIAAPDERDALIADGRFDVPPYQGKSGWLRIDLMAKAVGWDEIRELVETSYRQVAGVRRVRELDARR